MQHGPFPFKILALAPFDMNPSRIWDQLPVAVHRHNLDDAISAMTIEHVIELEPTICRPGGFKMAFPNLKSLHPDGMVKNHPFFIQVDEAKAFIKEAHKKDKPADDIARGLAQYSDLPLIEIKAAKPKDRARRQTATVDHILEIVAAPGEDPHQAAVYHDEVSQLAAIQQKALSALFDLPTYRRMEAAWRGLRLLLQQGTINNTAKVEIAPIHRNNLEATLAALLPILIQDPPGIILLDLAFDNSPAAMNLLAKAAEWASTLMVPLVAWASCGFLQIPSWQDLSTLPFIPNQVQGASYAKYQSLKQSDGGHWICMTCNRFLIRYPYGKENRPRHVQFTESGPLWISPSWALGTLVARNMETTGWPSRFTDHQQYQIQDLAVANPTTTPHIVVETVLSRDRLDQFIGSGLTPLTTAKGSDSAFVPKAVTLSGDALAYQLLTSRVTAFILWCKDNLPAQTEPTALVAQLEKVFRAFSEQSRPPGFEAIDISAGPLDDNARIPIHVSLTPAAGILSGQRKIELALNW
jgi:predicted component of type VI protein secretion system